MEIDMGFGFDKTYREMERWMLRDPDGGGPGI